MLDKKVKNVIFIRSKNFKTRKIENNDTDNESDEESEDNKESI